MKVAVYVEGGGDTRRGDLATECRKGFATLLKKATGRNVAITACGSRNEAYKAVALAVNQRSCGACRGQRATRQRRGAVGSPEEARRLVAGRRPSASDGRRLETWLLADPGALREHFREVFDDKKIPKWPAIEDVDKADIFRALDDATKKRKGGGYSKARDSFKVLAKVDSTTLEARCPHAKLLFDDLRARMYDIGASR